MMFYDVFGTIKNPGWEQANEQRVTARQTVRKLSGKAADFNKCRDDGASFIIVEGVEADFEGIIVTRKPIDTKLFANEFFDACDLMMKDVDITEITFERFNDKLRRADRQSYIADADDVLQQYGIDALNNRFLGSDFGENMVDNRTKKAIFSSASKLLSEKTLIPELNRIFTGRKLESFCGHPVQYIIRTDDSDTRREMYRILLEVLHKRGRTESARYIYVDVDAGDNQVEGYWNQIFRCAEGGAIVFRFQGDVRENEYANSIRNFFETLGDLLHRYHNKVLSVFCFPRECNKVRNMLYEYLGGISFVELEDDLADTERAREYLGTLAAENGVEADETLLEKAAEGKTYLATDLTAMFDEWYADALKSKVFPQYKCVDSARHHIVEQEPQGSSYEKLRRMTGLTEAKDVIDRAINFYKAQKLFASKGMQKFTPAMHMVFTGNPGTAKTTVARLFADIMKDNGVLSTGGLHELGRADLVGRFVGWTAPTIKKRFNEAKGGVLFIDEAYSLVDDRDGSFGDEAINTIVQEMENHRDELIVIFAGYPDKMEKFLEKNPGLRSRIAFHVPFSDYNTDELCDIAKLMAEDQGLTLTDGAVGKLRTVFDVAGAMPDFGNGRYVRNTIEQAQMEHANRLVALNPDEVTSEQVKTLTEDDIVLPVSAQKTITRRIGF